MEHLDSYVKARQFYHKKWAPERRRVLKELESIRDEVQRQAKIHSIGSITYSSVGLVGRGLAIAGIITAPFTLGVSLGLTVAGIATGVTSGIAGVTHGAVKIGILIKQCNDAETSLESYVKHCKETMCLLELLKQDIDMINELKTSQIGEGLKLVGRATGVIKKVVDLVNYSKAAYVYNSTGNVNEATKMLRIGEVHVLDKIVPPAFKDVSKGVTLLSAKTLAALAAIGVIVDLMFLISNAVDLSKLNKGKLCSEAKKLQNVIEQMQGEYDDLKVLFS